MIFGIVLIVTQILPTLHFFPFLVSIFQYRKNSTEIFFHYCFYWITKNFTRTSISRCSEVANRCFFDFFLILDEKAKKKLLFPSGDLECDRAHTHTVTPTISEFSKALRHFLFLDPACKDRKIKPFPRIYLLPITIFASFANFEKSQHSSNRAFFLSASAFSSYKYPNKQTWGPANHMRTYEKIQKKKENFSNRGEWREKKIENMER